MDIIHPELKNIAPEFDEQELKEISNQCLRDYQNDEDSRADWLDMHSTWVELYFQKDRAKNPPWEGSSDESIPMLAEACNQFHARAFQAMFPSRNIIKVIPTGEWDATKQMRADRVSQHLSWQLLVKDKTYKRNKDRLLLSCPLHGSFFTKTYYCPVRHRNVTDNVRAVDLVVPYGTGPRELEDIDRKTEILFRTVDQVKKLERAGFFSDVAEPMNQSDLNEVDHAHADAEGIQESGYGTDNLCKILEQHRLLDLDDDGYAEPYIVWVCATSGKVLRIAIRWETDEDGEPIDDKEPVECYTHYPFLENPDGFYGLGYGHLVAPLNTAVNKLLRQSIDAGTLNNVLSTSGFVSKQAAINKGEIHLSMGKFVPTESAAEDLNKAFWQPRGTEPSQALLQVMELIMAKSDRLATVTEALTGQTEKVHQPTALMGLIEQGLQVFSSVYERLLNCWSSELDKHYRLNAKHLQPVEYFTVIGSGGGFEGRDVVRSDYADDLMVIPIADPKQVTKQQKMAKAEMVYNTLIQNPLVLQDPTMVAIYDVTRNFLEAAEVENIDELLPHPQELFNAAQGLAGVGADQGVPEEDAGGVPGGSGMADLDPGAGPAVTGTGPITGMG